MNNEHDVLGHDLVPRVITNKGMVINIDLSQNFHSLKISDSSLLICDIAIHVITTLDEVIIELPINIGILCDL